MRRITIWLFSTVAAVVLLFSYRTSTGGTVASSPAAAAAPANTGAAANTGATPAPSSSSSAASSKTGTSSKTGATPSPAATSASSATSTYTGSVAGTRWGDVQVTITVTGGKITDVQVPVYPSGNGRDEEINAYALPVLKQETLQAQSARIDAVSGATVTSDGYLQSLQSALDAAHLS